MDINSLKQNSLEGFSRQSIQLIDSQRLLFSTSPPATSSTIQLVLVSYFVKTPNNTLISHIQNSKHLNRIRNAINE